MNAVAGEVRWTNNLEVILKNRRTVLFKYDAQRCESGLVQKQCV